jgi:hypothetical protein
MRTSYKATNKLDLIPFHSVTYPTSACPRFTFPPSQGAVIKLEEDKEHLVQLRQVETDHLKYQHSVLEKVGE